MYHLRSGPPLISLFLFFSLQVQQADAVKSFFSTTIVIAINNRCFCGFPEVNLINGSVICPGDGSRDLVYRAYIVSLNDLTSSQLLRYVDDFVSSEPLISSGVAVIRFNPNCSTSVNSPNEAVCTNPALQEPTPGFIFDDKQILTVTLAGAVFLLLFIIIFILVCVIVFQQKQLRSLSFI